MKPDFETPDGRVKLWNRDCREVLPFVKADAVVTDPPYGVNIGEPQVGSNWRSCPNGHGLTKGRYANYDDTYENYCSIVVPAIRQCVESFHRVAVFVGPHIHELPKPETIGGVYVPAASGRTKWGFKNFLSVLLYGRCPDLHLGATIPTAISSNETAEKNGHPCPKPIGWMNWLVRLTTRGKETVLDPFMGSGTTGVAAVRLGRSFLGCEIDPTYFAIAVRRITAELESTPLLDAIETPETQVELFGETIA